MKTLGDTTCVGAVSNGTLAPLYRADGCDSYARVPHTPYVHPDVINNVSGMERGCLVESTWDSRSGREIFHPQSVLHQRSLLKQISNSVKEKLSTSCYHMRRGLKALVPSIIQNITPLSYVFKTDIYSYYQSIHHSTLLETLHNMSGPVANIS